MLSTRSVLAVAALAAGALTGPAAAHAAVGWSAPPAVVAGPAVAASVAVASDATVLAATTPGVFAAPGGATSFGAPSPFTDRAIDSVDLETDDRGGRHLAWTAGGQGFAAHATAGGDFGPAAPLGRAAEVDVAASPSGAAVVVWRERVDRSSNRILVARRPAGGALGAAQELMAGAVASNVVAAVDDTGTAVAAWRQIAGRYTVRAAVASADAPFGPVTGVSQQPQGGTALAPGAAFAAPGVPVLAWSQVGEDAGVRASTLADGAWSAPQAIGDGGTIETSLASIPSGGVVAAFDGGENVVMNAAGPDGRFGAPTALGPAPGNVVAEAAVAVDDEGAAHIAWGRPDTGELLVASGRPGAVRALGQIDWVQPGGGAIDIAAGAAGSAVVSWLRTGDGMAVLTSVHRRGSTVDPPVGPRPALPSELAGTGDGSGTSGRAIPAALRLRLASRTVRLGRGTTLPVTLTARSALEATFIGRLTAPRSSRGPKLDRMTRLTRASLAAGRATTVRVKLAPAALRALRRAVGAGRAVRLALEVNVTDASGRRAQQTLRLTVRRQASSTSRLSM